MQQSLRGQCSQSPTVGQHASAGGGWLGDRRVTTTTQLRPAMPQLQPLHGASKTRPGQGHALSTVGRSRRLERTQASVTRGLGTGEGKKSPSTAQNRMRENRGASSGQRWRSPDTGSGGSRHRACILGRPQFQSESPLPFSCVCIKSKRDPPNLDWAGDASDTSPCPHCVTLHSEEIYILCHSCTSRVQLIQRLSVRSAHN